MICEVWATSTSVCFIFKMRHCLYVNNCSPHYSRGEVWKRCSALLKSPWLRFMDEQKPRLFLNKKTFTHLMICRVLMIYRCTFFTSTSTRFKFVSKRSFYLSVDCYAVMVCCELTLTLELLNSTLYPHLRVSHNAMYCIPKKREKRSRKIRGRKYFQEIVEMHIGADA